MNQPKQFKIDGNADPKRIVKCWSEPYIREWTDNGKAFSGVTVEDMPQ